MVSSVTDSLPSWSSIQVRPMATRRRKGTDGERPMRSSGRQRKRETASLPFPLPPISSLHQLCEKCEAGDEQYRQLAIEAAASIGWRKRTGEDAWREA